MLCGLGALRVPPRRRFGEAGGELVTTGRVESTLLRLRLDRPRTLQVGGIPIEGEQFEPMTPVVAVNQSIHEPGRRFLFAESIEHLKGNSRGPDACIGE